MIEYKIDGVFKISYGATKVDRVYNVALNRLVGGWAGRQTDRYIDKLY